jgi:uncharacterized membrane protein
MSWDPFSFFFLGRSYFSLILEVEAAMSCQNKVSPASPYFKVNAVHFIINEGLVKVVSRLTRSFGSLRILAVGASIKGNSRMLFGVLTSMSFLGKLPLHRRDAYDLALFQLFNKDWQEALQQSYRLKPPAKVSKHHSTSTTHRGLD